MMASHIFLGHREALWTAEPVGCHHATGSGDGKGYFRILARDPPQDSSNARPDGCPQQSRPERAHRVEAAACNIHAEGSQYQTRRSSDRNGQPDRQAQLCRSLKPARTQKNARNKIEPQQKRTELRMDARSLAAEQRRASRKDGQRPSAFVRLAKSCSRLAPSWSSSRRSSRWKSSGCSSGDARCIRWKALTTSCFRFQATSRRKTSRLRFSLELRPSGFQAKQSLTQLLLSTRVSTPGLSYDPWSKAAKGLARFALDWTGPAELARIAT